MTDLAEIVRERGQLKYIVLATMRSGDYEAFGPFSSPANVESAKEQAEGLAWIERASVITLHTPTSLRHDAREANRRVL